MKRWIYVASSWRNAIQPAVVEALRDAGHHVYDFRHPAPGDDGFHWTEIDPSYDTWTPAQYRGSLAHPLALHGFESDFVGMVKADTCVLVLPCGRSAHLEAGYFVGAGKDLFILLDNPVTPELMYKMATAICLDLSELLSRLDAAPRFTL